MRAINKKSKEIKNKFSCPFCGSLRLRGTYVKVEKGIHEGYELKVCQNPQCMVLASLGMLQS